MPVEITRVSVSSTGQQANGGSGSPSISQDGRYVAFVSSASNLVPGDTNGDDDVFIHDLLTGDTTRVSVNSNGEQQKDPIADDSYSYYYPKVSFDGRYVGFVSDAENLVAGDTNGYYDAFVHDMVTGATTRVSVSSSGEQAISANAVDLFMSGDGRYISFYSSANNLVESDTNSASDVFVHDMQTGTTSRISVSSLGVEGNAGAGGGSISADGRYVLFYTNSSNWFNLDASDTVNGFIHDMQTGSTTLLNIQYPTLISGNGAYITFSSYANNLVPGDYDYIEDVFLYDIQTEMLQRVSVSSSGIPGNLNSTSPSISFDGNFIAFDSRASNLVPQDKNLQSDIFIHNMSTGKTNLYSIARNGAQGNDSSSYPSISSDGSYLAFTSWASNLVEGDTNQYSDIFVVKIKPISLTIDKTGDGLITSNPGTINCGPICTSLFEENAIVSLTATASPGFHFTSWSGDIIGTANPLNVTMGADKSITANFELDEYSLAITSSHGSVAKSPNQATYHYGDVVRLTANSDPTYAFYGWSGGATGASNPLDITIHGNTQVTATFIQNGRTLKTTSGHGTVVRSPERTVYKDGDLVQLTAQPSPGFVFDHWSGDISGTSNPTNVTISGDTSITANYSWIEYTLAITSAHGTVTRSPDQATYHYGDVVHLTAIPDVDYDFLNWSGDSSSTANPIDLVIDRNTSLIANYELTPFTLTVSKTGNGTGTISSNPAGINCGTDCSAPYAPTTTITLTALPSPSSYFKGWEGSGCSGTGSCTVKLLANTSITANFSTYRVFLPIANKPFTKASPANGSEEQGLMFALYWNSGGSNVTYEWCLDDSDNNTCNTSWHDVGSSLGVQPWYSMSINYDTTYYWQVRVHTVDGTIIEADDGNWWSITTIWKPKAGFWFDETNYVYFFVTPDQNKVSGFTVPVNFPCGLYWITRPIPGGDISIRHDYHDFYANGNLYAAGIFTSKTTANGSTALDSVGPICGDYWWSQTWYWNAIWLDDSQPSSMSSQAMAVRESYAIKSVQGDSIYKGFNSVDKSQPTATPARR